MNELLTYSCTLRPANCSRVVVAALARAPFGFYEAVEAQFRGHKFILCVDCNAGNVYRYDRELDELVPVVVGTDPRFISIDGDLTT